MVRVASPVRVGNGPTRAGPSAAGSPVESESIRAPVMAPPGRGQARRAADLARFGILAGLGGLLAAGVAGREAPALFGGALFVAAGVAVARALVGPGRWEGVLTVGVSFVDGAAAAALVSADGGARSGLDVLFLLAMLALVVQVAPGLVAALAALDVGLYALAVVASPAFSGSQDLRVLGARVLLLGVVGVGAYLIGRAAARCEAAGKVAPGRGLAEGSVGERPSLPVGGRASLIAMLSHDLRTPLTSVKGFAQLLARESSASEQTRRYAGVIVSEANRAIRTLADAVDLSRLQQGQNELRLEGVDLGPVLTAAVAALEHHDPEQRLRLSVPEGLPAVQADPARLERLMVNLVSSVLRYSPGATPIVVGARSDGVSVLVWVRDEGEGLSAEKFAHIVASEFGVPVAEQEFNGSGLGLYISKQLVQAHGSELTVQGEGGRGCQFEFRLRT